MPSSSKLHERNINGLSQLDIMVQTIDAFYHLAKPLLVSDRKRVIDD